MHATVADLDFIEEIRLRRWAREHYVAPEERDESWHPVVLDEMRMKDDDRGRTEDDLTLQHDVI